MSITSYIEEEIQHEPAGESPRLMKHTGTGSIYFRVLDGCGGPDYTSWHSLVGTLVPFYGKVVLESTPPKKPDPTVHTDYTPCKGVSTPTYSTPPSWVNWLAKDADGSWYGYEYRPMTILDGWVIGQLVGKTIKLGQDEPCEYWETTLERV